ncbi:MAG: hypothetical protein ACLUSL_02745 [Ruminococcus sp.]
MSKNTRPNAADPRRKRIAAGDFRQSAAAFALSALSDFADQAAIQRHNFNSHRCKKADGYAELTFSAESSGIDETRSRHSPAVLLYHTHLLSQEEVIIRHFCRCYQATLLSAEREQQKMAVLRIPLCDETTPLFLQSGVRRFRSDEDSLYEIMLADISEYRFY